MNIFWQYGQENLTAEKWKINEQRRGEMAKKMFDIECVVEVCLTNLTSAPMDIKMRSLQLGSSWPDILIRVESVREKVSQWVSEGKDEL